MARLMTLSPLVAHVPEGRLAIVIEVAVSLATHVLIPLPIKFKSDVIAFSRFLKTLIASQEQHISKTAAGRSVVATTVFGPTPHLSDTTNSPATQLPPGFVLLFNSPSRIIVATMDRYPPLPPPPLFPTAGNDNMLNMYHFPKTTKTRST